MAEKYKCMGDFENEGGLVDPKRSAVGVFW